MQPARGPTALLALVCLLGTAGAARAQRGDPAADAPAKRYEHFPIDGDLQQILQARLLDLGKTQEVARWLEELKKKAGNLPWLQKDLDLDPADPKLADRLKDLQRRLQQDFKIDPAQLKPLQDALKQKFPDLPRPPDVKPKDVGPAPPHPEQDPPRPPKGKGATPPPRPPQPPAPRPAPAEDHLSRWAEKLMQRIEHTRLGEKLSESPDWQRGLRGLRDGLSGGKFSLPGVSPDGFRLPGDFNLSLPDLKGLKLPDVSLSRFRPPEINFSLPRLGGLGGGGAPSPGGAGLGAVGQAALWVALAALLGVIAWRALTRGGWRTRREAQAPAARGAWPVAPGSVSTPAELIAAFEHLALLRLGPTARSSNHRDIADGLGGDGAALRAAADELAALYEQARYDPAPAALDGPQVEAARRHLSHLAGAGAA